MASNGTNGHVAHDSALDIGDAEKTRLLEEENGILREKVGAASERFADYENEIRVLQAKLRQWERRNAANLNPNSPAEPAKLEKPGISRFGSFIGSRKPVPVLVPAVPTTDPSVREAEFTTALAKEQAARAAAEQKVKEVHAEVEELSATLFQQANEMVATARRENAVLKERIEELERAGGDESDKARKEIARLGAKVQAMEKRDTDRSKRLDRLDAAQKRVDRVKAMLIPR